MIVELSKVTPISTMDGVEVRVLATGEKIMMIHGSLEKGVQAPLHSHPHEQLGFVLEGEMIVTIGHETHRATAGDSYLVPGGVDHKVQSLSEVKLLEVFSPPRGDYRQ